MRFRGLSSFEGRCKGNVILGLDIGDGSWHMVAMTRNMRLLMASVTAVCVTGWTWTVTAVALWAVVIAELDTRTMTIATTVGSLRECRDATAFEAMTGGGRW